MKDVLSDWHDVLLSSLSSEEIVILLVSKNLRSSQAVTEQRTSLSARKRSELSVVSLAMSVAGRWAQVLRNRIGDAQSCHGMPWEHREYQTQMSWEKMFAADDVSTRKVERVFDVNLG